MGSNIKVSVPGNEEMPMLTLNSGHFITNV